MSQSINEQINSRLRRLSTSVCCLKKEIENSSGLPDQTGHSGEFLTTDGSIASWAAVSGSGEANTASNLGGGLANFSAKVGVDLQFNSFAAADFDLTANVISIGDNAVTYAKIQDVTATNRFIGRITAGSGDPEELTGTQATTLLDAFTSGLKGLAPASGGGTTNFLRADGTWAAPPAGGGITINSTAITSGTAGRILFENASNQVSQDANLFWDDSNDRLGIGVTPLVGLHVQNAGLAESGFVANMILQGTAAYSTAPVTGISFRQKFNAGGSYTPLAGIVGGKQNVADGDFKGRLIFSTRDGVSQNVAGMELSSDQTLKVLTGIYIGDLTTTPTALLHLKAGTATANTAPLKFTTGTNLGTPEAGTMEYSSGRFSLTDTDATRRHIVQAAASSKTTAGAPYTNDGYIEVIINGTTVKLMTTA